MTTVAYRNGIIASDSLSVSGDLKGTKQKIYEHGDKIYCVTGDFNRGIEMIEALKNGTELKPPVGDNWCRVIVFTKGVNDKWLEYENSLTSTEEDGEYMSWGSGRMAALGAMAMGASAEQAVKIASDFDINTGGEIKCTALT